ncbi:MAG: HTH-type transcriptional regulator CelR [Actinomycetota bacterium]
MSRSNVTLSDIAERAGVSPATVSRVLNGDSRVNPARVARINKVIEELGYAPNRAARTLATGRTGLVAAVIDSNLNVFSDPFWGVITTGVSRALQDSNMQALLMVRPLNEVDPQVITMLTPGHVDGAIFFQLHNDDVVRRLQALGLPCVIVGRPDDAAAFPYVDSDNFGGAEIATTHLIQRGCRTIATIAGNVSLSAGRLRLDGYRSALSRAGIPVEDSLVHVGDWTDESGETAMAELLSRRPDIDGVFIANDSMAIGALAALDERGIDIPNQVAVIGFDNMFAGRLGRRQLTTVQQDVEALGATAASMVIEAIQGATPASVVLPTHLVVRETA